MPSLFRPYLLPAITALALLAATGIHANDIQVTNHTLTGTNTANATTQVQFDISWANSWRTSSAPNNWDAAWVFVKYRDANTGLWQHAQLGSDAQHSAPAGSTIATGLLTPGTAYNAATNWGVGAFIHRSADGTGTFAANGAQLRWNYGQSGITYADIAEVKVFAVEMVYVPQGSFSLGSGGAETNGFKDGTTNNPFPINSEGAITMANVNGSLWAANNTYIQTATLPAAFPKGFAGFYVMKYEITQRQYVDFLNTLTRTQQNNRTGTNLALGVTSVTNRFVMSNSSTSIGRNGIRCDAIIDANAPINFYCDLNGNGTGDEVVDGQWIGCNYLEWADLSAYLDWSGLRPMTELEYEKACRGTMIPVANEYAWGNASARNGIYSGSNLGTTDEGVSDPETGISGNAIHDNSFTLGPMRVGLFAGLGSNRVNSGASFYGTMELSGNLFERIVTVSNATGRLFEGNHGEGSVDSEGNANTNTWPGTIVTGTGDRGGSFARDVSMMRVSDRQRAGIASSGRIALFGGRGLRVLP